tara:strand:- start:1927 stop:3012 length:1086 start_codon:yes stop_codon:yes gene_type:complete
MSENKNQLMEAAAEVLAQSKAKAPAEPMPKVDTSSVGGMQDLGGPTPSNNKPDDDSNKINASGMAPDNSAKNQATIKTKPSAASAKMEETEAEEEEVIQEKGMPQGLKDFLAKKKEKMKEEVSEDVESLFAEDDNVSADFKKKASTIYEARVNDRVTQIVEEIEGQYATKFEEAVTEIKTELTEKVDDYLNYVVEQWMTDNQIAVESGLRAELTEEFISGLRNLFAEHYIDVPEEKVDLVDELATRVEALESQLDEEMERGMEFAKALVTARQNEITAEVCEGLTDTQEEKIKSLAESVDFSTEEEFREKVQTIRENYFPSEVKQADEETLNEKVETDADKKVSNDPFVDAVSKAISQTQK